MKTEVKEELILLSYSSFLWKNSWKGMHKWSVAEILCSSEIFIKYFSDEDSSVIISITFLNAQMENAGIS